MKLYEAMFLLNPNETARNWDEVRDLVHSRIEREGGKIVSTQKFDDMRLAYDMRGFKRATYYLVHFEGEGSVIAPLRRSAGLEESILRVLVLLDEDGAAELNPTILQGMGPDQFGRPSYSGRDGRRDRDRRDERPGRYGHGDRDARDRE
ncbi:MAG: 30S ribosomal protein S6 [Planctomycetota bacterium]